MLQCLNCGRDLSPRAVACPECGEPGPAAPVVGTAAPPAPGGASVGSVMASVDRTEPFAIASIVCAVANFLGGFLIGAILAIIFGKIAQNNIAANPALGGAGLARAGIIVGWVGVGIVVAFLLLGVTMFGFLGGLFSDLPVRFTS